MEHFDISHQPDAGADVVPLIGEAIAALKPREQRSVAARFFEEASFKEIAQAETISEDAAQKRVTRALEKMRQFLSRRGVRIAGAVAIPALITQSSKAADPTLVSGIIGAVTAAKSAGTSTGVYIVIAAQAAKWIAWKDRALLALKIACAFVIIGTPPAIYVFERKPPLPATVPLPAPPPQITALARQWAGLVRQIDAMIAKPPPPITTLAGARYNFTLQQLGAQSSQLITTFSALLTPQNEETVVPQFLATELTENLALDPRQHAYLFLYITQQFKPDPSFKDSLNALYDNRASHARSLRAVLSLHQRRKFDIIYGPTGLGLFSIAPTLASAR